MFIALDKRGKLVDINESERGRDYFCPTCNSELKVRKGEKNIPHFAHKSNANCVREKEISKWRYEWLSLFSKEDIEIKLDENSENVADVIIGDYVIDFYNKYPKNEYEIVNKIEFYNERNYNYILVQNCIGKDIIQRKNEKSKFYTWTHATKKIPDPVEEIGAKYCVFLQQNEDELLWLDKTYTKKSTDQFKHFAILTTYNKEEFIANIEKLLKIRGKFYINKKAYLMGNGTKEEIERFAIGFKYAITREEYRKQIEMECDDILKEKRYKQKIMERIQEEIKYINQRTEEYQKEEQSARNEMLKVEQENKIQKEKNLYMEMILEKNKKESEKLERETETTAKKIEKLKQIEVLKSQLENVNEVDLEKEVLELRNKIAFINECKEINSIIENIAVNEKLITKQMNGIIDIIRRTNNFSLEKLKNKIENLKYLGIEI